MQRHQCLALPKQESQEQKRLARRGILMRAEKCRACPQLQYVQTEEV